MNTPDWSPTYNLRHATTTELLSDHRERLAIEEEERVKQRTLQIEELRSEFNSAQVRIRAWEKMHGLSLPANPTHPVLDVITSATGIPLATLREEQQARRTRQAPQLATNGGVAAGV